VINVFRPKLFLPQFKHFEFRGLLCKQKNPTAFPTKRRTLSLSSYYPSMPCLNFPNEMEDRVTAWLGWLRKTTEAAKGAELFFSGLDHGA